MITLLVKICKIIISIGILLSLMQCTNAECEKKEIINNPKLLLHLKEQFIKDFYSHKDKPDIGTASSINASLMMRYTFENAVIYKTDNDTYPYLAEVDYTIQMTGIDHHDVPIQKTKNASTKYKFIANDQEWFHYPKNSPRQMKYK